MRVISGTAKHLPLKTVEGQETRPTTDRIKETLFNMIQNEIYGCRFLDLFAGSGAIGIEALSRGAEAAVFVEQNRRAADCIRENLSFTHLSQKAHVMRMDVFQALSQLQEGESFDIVFMDPPYDRELEKKVLEILAKSDRINEQSLIITEASLKTDFSYLDSMGFEMKKYKKYKTNAHIFIKKKERTSQ